MNTGNIMLAVDLIGELTKRITAYTQMITRARAENRDLTDAELDAVSTEAGLALELAHKRIADLKK